VTHEFPVPKINVVQSDAGFTVEVVWLTRVRYTRVHERRSLSLNPSFLVERWRSIR